MVKPEQVSHIKYCGNGVGIPLKVSMSANSDILTSDITVFEADRVWRWEPHIISWVISQSTAISYSTHHHITFSVCLPRQALICSRLVLNLLSSWGWFWTSDPCASASKYWDCSYAPLYVAPTLCSSNSLSVIFSVFICLVILLKTRNLVFQFFTIGNEWFLAHGRQKYKSAKWSFCLQSWEVSRSCMLGLLELIHVHG